jgi:hypothetical protein
VPEEHITSTSGSKGKPEKKPVSLPPASGGFLVDSLFHNEDGGDMFLPKHESFSTLYGVTTHKAVTLFMVNRRHQHHYHHLFTAFIYCIL